MKYIFRLHAIRRMAQRGISKSEVYEVIKNGITIETYPDDLPYPNRLIMGRSNNRALHVVFAEDNENNETIIITVYEPDSDKWENNVTRRRK